MLKKILNLYLLLTFTSLKLNGQSQNITYFIDEGQRNSPLLKEYDNLIRSQASDSLILMAEYKPQVSATSQAMYAPVTNHFGYDSAITNGGNYSALVNITQTLLNRNAKKIKLNNLSVLNQALNVNFKITATELKKNITTLYLDAFSDYSKLLFNKQLFDLLKKEESSIEQLVMRGVYMQTDLMNLKIAIKTVEISLKKSNIEYKNKLSVLNQFCGINDTITPELENPKIELTNFPDINASPIMMRLTTDSLQNISAQQLVSLGYRPKLTAFADAGFNAINPNDFTKHLGTSIGLNFALPIYDGNLRKQKFNKIKLEENTRLNNKSFYIGQFNQQFFNLSNQLTLTNDLISTIESQVNEQEKLMRLYKIEIEQGLVKFMDFINTLNSYSSTVYSLKEAKMDRLQLINQMNYLK